MNTFYFNIAGFGVRVMVDLSVSGFTLPLSYTPFLAKEPVADPVMTLEVVPDTGCRLLEGCRPVATGINDLGEARLFRRGDSYSVAISPFPGSGFRVMHMNADFSLGRLYLGPDDRYAAFTFDSMMRILFSQAIVSRDAFLIHASAVVSGGEAFLFMGRSGTGKSTHSSLWQREVAGTSLLNDDNPVVRAIPDGSFAAFGSPWSGKTPCYRNASAPLRAMVRLRQSPVNIFRPLADVAAFVAVLPGVSVISHCRPLYEKVCSTAIAATSAVCVGELLCRPDAGAVTECRRGIIA